MRSLFVLLAAALSASAIPAHGFQEREPDFSRIADDLVGVPEEDDANDEAYENLMQLIANPIDLNRAGREELRQLHLLTENQIQELIAYRKEVGALITVYELQAVPGFDLDVIRALLPFVSVNDPHSRINSTLLRRAVEPGHAYLIARFERSLETKKGFNVQDDSTQKFQGNQAKRYIRFRSSIPGDFSVGLTAEQDAGEHVTWNTSKGIYGADFFSWHAQLLNKGRIKNIILGDFQCQFAQGLTLGSAFGLGKGAETITTARRSNTGLLPYTSANESGFYRGAGATYQVYRTVALTGFYSTVSRDAVLQQDNDGSTVATTQQNTGLHRNTRELRHRKALAEQSYGLVLNYQHNTVDAGVLYRAVKFEYPFRKDPSPYNQFAFEGRQNANAGAFLNVTFGNVSFFSEAARSSSRGNALLAGLMGSLHPNFDVTVVYRKFDRHFHTFYANPFSESSAPQNETGLYWGWKYRWNRKYNLSGYLDLFRFPWLGFRRYAPADGYEGLLRFNYQPSRKVTMFIQLREESKARNIAAENLYHTAQGVKRNAWASAAYTGADRITFKTRVQYSTFTLQQKISEGMALTQDVSVTIKKIRITARHAVFDTDDFDNRQYVYENDVWLAFSLPAYAGKGLRNFILLEYKVNKALSVWFRYARTRYRDRNEIGSGLEQVAGNTKNDVKFQALLRF